MKIKSAWIAAALLLPCAVQAPAQTFTFEKISNELSLYQNYSDEIDTRGQTVQVVAINRVRIGWWFQTEFTADFNYDYDKAKAWDYYLEIGIVKSLFRGLSINYQRIEGTFVAKPTNQVGLRWTF
jgi:hypothetical protein